jgi:hypothetical protein
MKKLIIFSSAILLLAVWYGESRKFFCLGNGACVTVWKTYNNVCFIMPGKYYGIIKPSRNYIETSNINLVTIFYSTELPKALIIRPGLEVKIINGDTNEFSLYNYEMDTTRFNKLLFIPTKNGSELKPDIWLMNIDIRENNAFDKDGKRL